jgi:hypothetical protein
VRHKLAVLHEHCAAEGRDPAEIEVTHLAAARVIADGEPRESRGAAREGRGAARKGRGVGREGRGAATVEEHVGRYRELAEAGVETAIVGLGDAEGPDSVSRFAEVVAAFR